MPDPACRFFNTLFMKALVTGANGFLGYYLVEELLQRGHEVIATGRGTSQYNFNKLPAYRYVEMDFADPFRVHDVFSELQPQVVIHAGAMTRVDACEENQWNAYVANVEGTVTLLLNAEQCRSFFLFVSTDFIFDGEKGMYTEDDLPNPVNFYGKTKVEAEDAVKEYEFDWAIARTVLVYGAPHNKSSNILTTVMEKLQKGEEYKLVTDQSRTPTYVADLAKGIAAIIEKKARGIFHLSGKDVLSPYEMGCSLALEAGLEVSLLKPVDATSFRQQAKRPPVTGFRIEKARKILDYDPISFREGLKLTLKGLNSS